MLIFKCTQDEVLRALSKVAGIVERRHTLPILANVMLQKTGQDVQFTSSDLEIQLRCTAAIGADSGQILTTVNARKLLDILRTMPADQVVSLESQENKLLLKGGKSRFSLQTLPAQDFPLVQESTQLGPAFELPQKVLKNLLSQVSFAMAVQDIRYYLNGVLFVAEGTRLSLVATDGHRLAFSSAQLQTEVPKQEVIIPRKTVLELQRLLSDGNEDMMQLQFAQNQAKFSFGDMEFVSKLVEGKFPDYNRVIPQNHQYQVVLGRIALLSTLQRSAVMTSEKFKGVKFGLAAGQLRVSSTNAEQEEASDELDINYDGPSMEMGFNVNYLMEVLSNMSQEMVQLEVNDANSSVVFCIPDNADFRYVVMPMRI